MKRTHLIAASFGLSAIVAGAVLHETGAVRWLLTGTRADLNYDCFKPVPPGSIEERHRWGERRLGQVYLVARDWISKSKFIESQVGKVSGIAPIGKPNCHSRSFVDAYPSLTIQVTAEKGEGVARCSDLTFCVENPSSERCLESSLSWTVGKRTVQVHISDIPMFDFNRSGRRRELLTKRIESRDNPHDRLSRADAFALAGRWSEAEKDLERAIDLEPPLDPKTKFSPDTKESREQFAYLHYSSLREKYRRLAFVQYCNRDFAAAARTIATLIGTPAYRSESLRDHLWQWICLSKAGKRVAADKVLLDRLESSTPVVKQCWEPVVRALLDGSKADGNIDALVERIKSRQTCKWGGEADAPMIVYFLAQKELMEGRKKEGRRLLELFFQKNWVQPNYEYLTALRDLDQLSRFDRDTLLMGISWGDPATP